MLIQTTLLLLLMAQAAVFQRGDAVRVKGENRVRVVRVIAVPGDRVRIEDSGVYVNGAKVDWVSGDLLSALPKPWTPEVMADRQYFVAGSERTESNGTLNKGEYWGYVPDDSLEKATP
jgi:hypothetical protein